MEKDEKHERLRTAEEEHLARGMEPWHFPRREQVASNIEGGCLVVFYLIRVQLTSDYITSKHWWQFLEYFTFIERQFRILQHVTNH